MWKAVRESLKEDIRQGCLPLYVGSGIAGLCAIGGMVHMVIILLTRR